MRSSPSSDPTAGPEKLANLSAPRCSPFGGKLLAERVDGAVAPALEQQSGSCVARSAEIALGAVLGGNGTQSLTLATCLGGIDSVVVRSSGPDLAHLAQSPNAEHRRPSSTTGGGRIVDRCV